MQNFDNYIIHIINRLSHIISPLTDVMVLIANNNLVKGGLVISILWYLWFNKNSIYALTKEKIILTLYASILAIIVGRGLALILPYRARPILNSNFNFTFELDKFSYLNTWSSFPSDHAVLFFSLTTGTYLISKKWGIISFAYVLIFIAFPRIYLGFHYLTDIIAGAGIGILITCIFSCQKTIQLLSKNTLALSTKFPGIFYACLFLLSYQIASMFEQSRALASFIISLIK